MVKQIIFLKFCLFSTIMLSFYQPHAAETGITENTPMSLSNFRVISKFPSRAEAEKLAYSLNKSDQNVHIISQNEEITLKSLSLGLYPNQAKADAVIKHLKANHIEAFLYRGNSGQYRVHTGAMQSEDHYWSRFEQLLALGYKRINTRLKTLTVARFFVVRELIEDLPRLIPIVSIAPVPLKTGDKATLKTINNRLLFGRFKGEFGSWKVEDKQSSSSYFSASLGVRTELEDEWNLTYGLRFDAIEQSSINNVQRFELQWLPTYLQIQEPNNLIQFGLIDGRWDDRQQTSLSDRLSSKILTRYLLDDDVFDRRRPIFGVRWQFNQSDYQLDAIINPVFRPAKLPVFESIWHPFNRNNQAILGIRPTANWQALVKNGSIAKAEKYQIGGGGVRMTHKIGQRTRAITLQFARRSEPYYELNKDIQQLITNGTNVDVALATTKGDAFTARHPHSAIFSWEEFGKVSHFEVTAATKTPYTTTSYEMKTALSLEWMLGFIYPTKDKNTHISSFFIGRRLNTREDILDRKTKLGLKGEIHKKSSSQRWKVGMAYQIDFDQLGFNLNPKINYEQNKYLNLSLYYQLFRGDESTNNGFYRNNSLLGLSWQAIF